MSFTDHYGLQRLTDDDISENSFKFSDADRVAIDRLLYLGAEGHRHTGGAASSDAPTLGPTVQLVTSSGSIPSSRRVYYKYTYVDGDGLETTESPEVHVDTPAAISSPAAPTLATTTTTGTLNPGSYYYALSAYQSFDDLETVVGTAAYIAVPYTTATNKNTLTLPTLPSGATGFNVYRKGPANVGYRYLASTTSSSFVDNGSYTEDPDRPVPSTNSTTSTNSVVLTLPGATPALPVIGWSWRIYRTYVTGDYTNSLLTTTTSVTYTDTGAATAVGEPPPVGSAAGSPSKILLTDAAEVQGLLPVANIADFDLEVLDAVDGFPHVVKFEQSGGPPLVVSTGSFVWVAPRAGRVVSVRPSVGRGAAPASTRIFVDINKGTNTATPTYTTIYTTQANRPYVAVGQQVGVATVPAVTTFVAGETYSMDVDQVGGGATPTDKDLVVLMYVLFDA